MYVTRMANELLLFSRQSSTAGTCRYTLYRKTTTKSLQPFIPNALPNYISRQTIYKYPRQSPTPLPSAAVFTRPYLDDPSFLSGRAAHV